ncbi:MAG: molybdopterin cofactor-binding domain-containing protein, partial [Bacteroidota bacterium]
MSVIKTSINRRSFLKVSATASGGMVLGFSWLASCTPTPAQVKAMPKEWFDINAFLKIGDNGIVTIMSPNPEIGQNVKTSMPMIVAEELDVAWEDVIVEQAGLNTVKYKRQLAGGSQSIRQGWQGLRMAGATARHMLVEAAAVKLAVPAAELKTENGKIIHEKSGQSLGYGEVALAAASIEVPEEVELKDPKDFKIIGTSRSNVDLKEIITGKPLFGLDVQREGMLIAMIEHPPAFGMKLKSFDASMAKTMSGIKDVFSFKTYPTEIEKTWSDTNAFPELVAIVGNSTWEVMKAKKTLQIEWEQDTEAENTADHVAELEQMVSKGVPKASRLDGNPDSAFRGAAKIIERSYSAPFLAHNTMEPMNFFA